MLFSALACFSPSVPHRVKGVWEAHGGQVARTAAEKSSAAFFFCAGLNDPWLPTLSSRGVVVFWSTWVVHCAAAGTLLALSSYVLDGLFQSGKERNFASTPSVTCYSPRSKKRSDSPPSSQTDVSPDEALDDALDESRIEAMLVVIPKLDEAPACALYPVNESARDV